jgi:hypothetical protein
MISVVARALHRRDGLTCPARKLTVIELGVPALAIKQFVMSALLDDPAVLDHQDHIRIADR